MSPGGRSRWCFFICSFRNQALCAPFLNLHFLLCLFSLSIESCLYNPRLPYIVPGLRDESYSLSILLVLWSTRSRLLGDPADVTNDDEVTPGPISSARQVGCLTMAAIRGRRIYRLPTYVGT
ncbi:hypothetical protein F5Y12DRAFT_222142 [Xylaria sp. FL1777]|nr:hypothetical protein F5Y12DRAFT_222142 [Xylaria sp. FL1777]